MIPSPERQEEFLATMPNVIVATVRRTGLPQLTPVWYLWTGEEIWISCAASTAKVHNLRRDARIVLCIDDPVSGDYVQIIGTARLIEGPEVREPTLALIRKYREEARGRPALGEHQLGGRAGDHHRQPGTVPVARSLTGSTRTSANAPWAELSDRPSLGTHTSSSNGAPGTATPPTVRVPRPAPTNIAQMSS